MLLLIAGAILLLTAHQLQFQTAGIAADPGHTARWVNVGSKFNRPVTQDRIDDLFGGCRFQFRRWPENQAGGSRMRCVGLQYQQMSVLIWRSAGPDPVDDLHEFIPRDVWNS
jgi:hypothetical protein